MRRIVLVALMGATVVVLGGSGSAGARVSLKQVVAQHLHAHWVSQGARGWLNPPKVGVGAVGRLVPRAGSLSFGSNVDAASTVEDLLAGQSETAIDVESRCDLISVELLNDTVGAILKLRLDAAEGVSNNVVEARIASLLAGPAAGFTATGWAAGDPSATAISGVVLDNSNQPVPGVTLRIKGYPQTAQTNALGTFRIAGAPVGTLYLIVDGSTAESPGSWPDLEFVMTTIAGRDNTLGMPIYLLPLDLANGVLIDETRGGILKLPEVPGFALEIAPGSVTFPQRLPERSGECHRRALGQNSHGPELRPAAAAHRHHPAGRRPLRAAGQADAAQP